MVGAVLEQMEKDADPCRFCGAHMEAHIIWWRTAFVRCSQWDRPQHKEAKQRKREE